MPVCKNCHSQEITKSGFVRSKQRFRCKACGYNFVLGDERSDPQTVVKRAFAVILYVVGKVPYRSIAQLFGVSISTVHNWIISESALLHTSQIPDNCHELRFDEMWDLIGSNTANVERIKQFLIQPAESLPGLSVIQMVIPPSESPIHS